MDNDNRLHERVLHLEGIVESLRNTVSSMARTLTLVVEANRENGLQMLENLQASSDEQLRLIREAIALHRKTLQVEGRRRKKRGPDQRPRKRRETAGGGD